MDKLDSLLDVAAPQISVSELAYLDNWRAHAGTLTDPFALAVRGGAMADRFAWVFIAGYQAALRATFPDVGFVGWSALAVSEDRGDVDPLPGVIWRTEREGFRVSGYKTWVAASDHVAQIVVKARGPERGQSKYFLVDRSTSGVTIDTNPTPSMLPDLSQGRARLDDIWLTREDQLDATRVTLFSQLEAFYIYVAFLAMVYRLVSVDDGVVEARTMKSRAYAAICLAQDIHQARSGGELDAEQLGELDELVQEIRQHLSDVVYAADASWLRDQRLVEMYSKGLQSKRT